MFALSLLSNACLVTGDVEFEQPTNPTLVRQLAPEAFGYVPEVDPDCPAAQMAFRAEISDLDVDEFLFAVLWGNPGTPLRSAVLPIPPTTDRARVRALKHCQTKDLFTKRCNVATLVVGPDIDAVQAAPSRERAFDVDTTQWILLGPSSLTPEAEDNDCLSLFSDAGVP